jgi:hypothetical protein
VYSFFQHNLWVSLVLFAVIELTQNPQQSGDVSVITQHAFSGGQFVAEHNLQFLYGLIGLKARWIQTGFGVSGTAPGTKPLILVLIVLSVLTVLPRWLQTILDEPLLMPLYEILKPFPYFLLGLDSDLWHGSSIHRVRRIQVP